MKTIGFIDYHLDEWHGNHLPEWIEKHPANTAGWRVAFAWGEKKSPEGVTSREWCDKNKAALCASIEEVCEKSDALVILSPNNPEKHLEHAQKALPYKKRTYVDKTFAPGLRQARAIFDLAAQYKTPLCSSSALRFASEIAECRGKAKSVFTTGGGPSYDIYAIHQFEMIVKVMGTGAEKIMALNDGLNITLAAAYQDGRKAVFNQLVNANVPFAVGMETKGAKAVEYRPIESDFFANFTGALLGFFDGGKAFADKKETLEVIALIEAGKKALAQCGRWVKVPAV
ncbi:MAG: hypothetical protein LBG95_03375 [Treponema sp.]|jgi:hypothetical protein|nr:hypothetical protein [Treponema sp.]